MEDRGGGGGGSFVAVRRISHGLDRSNTCNTTLELCFLFYAQLRLQQAQQHGLENDSRGREGDSRPSFDLTPAQLRLSKHSKMFAKSKHLLILKIRFILPGRLLTKAAKPQ
ncbi:hypothetical protein LXL04_033873 [Taraxacum kok-saghyz]